MPDERAPGATTRGERDRPEPQSESDRRVQGDMMKDAKSGGTTKKDVPPRTYDMDQPGMDPDDNDTA